METAKMDKMRKMQSKEKETRSSEPEAAASCGENTALAPERAASLQEKNGAAEKKKGVYGVKIFNYKLVYVLLMVLVMSFAGFVVENLFRLLRDGVINSRRQILPFLFAYGIAVFVMYVAIGTPREMRLFKWSIFKKESKLSSASKYVCYFLVVFAFIFFGEMMFGTFVEWVSGVVLWDYTGIPLRFTKYTSIPTALGLAAGILLFMRFVFEPLMKKFEKMDESTAWIIDLSVGIPIVIDWLVMLILMLGFQFSENWWSITLW